MRASLTTPAAPSPPRSFHVMTKPIGPICNLGCDYCFYLEKQQLYPETRRWAMPGDVLEEYVRQYIAAQQTPDVQFAWQGGEPTLLGVDFFRNAVALQKKYAGGRTVHNSLQTNGTLLDDGWCAFLAEHKFLVGLSVDGPRDLHDAYRVDKHRRPTFDAVTRGLALLKKHGVEFNTLTVVNRANSKRPLDVYRFLKQAGSGFIQFIPLVERHATARVRGMGLDLMDPPLPGRPREDEAAAVTDWSVEPEQYGAFLCAIFDEWVRNDVGRVFVQTFDVTLGQWAGAGAGLCVFAERCGNAMAIEHNGDVYSCDHYVYPQYKLGNVMRRSLAEMATSPQQRRFGTDKSDTLPGYCRACRYRFACNGECPKHRFLRTPDGDEGLNYLCAGYKQFFAHVDPYMRLMADLLGRRQAPALVMDILRQREGRGGASQTVAKDTLCPCGSGMKFGRCCGKKR